MAEFTRFLPPTPAPPAIIELRRWRPIIAPVDAPPPMKTALRLLRRTLV
jgi:hypothetical protein